MGRRRHPPEFRRKVLDLVDAGRPVTRVAEDLGIQRPVYVCLESARTFQNQKEFTMSLQWKGPAAYGWRVDSTVRPNKVR